MSDNNLIPIERLEGVTLYGRVLNTGRVGQYEVHSDFLGHDGIVYYTYPEAEIKMKKLIGIRTK